MLIIRVRTLAIVLLFSLFLSPDINLITGMPSVRLEDFIFFLVLIYYLKSWKVSYLPRYEIISYFYVIMIFCLWMIIAIFANNRILAVGDHFEIYKMVKYSVVCYLFFRFENLSVNNIRLVKMLSLVFSMMLLFNFANLTNLGGFNASVLKIYAPIHHIENMESEVAGTRLLGTMGNPNNNAILWGRNQ